MADHGDCPLTVVGKGTNIPFPTSWKRYKCTLSNQLEKIQMYLFQLVAKGTFTLFQNRRANSAIFQCCCWNFAWNYILLSHQPPHPSTNTPRRIGGSWPRLNRDKKHIGVEGVISCILFLYSVIWGGQVRKRKFKKQIYQSQKFDLSTLWTYLQNNHIHCIHLSTILMYQL